MRRLPSPLLSIRDAVLTVSPKRQYLGIFRPTTPATQGPETHGDEFYEKVELVYQRWATIEWKFEIGWIFIRKYF